MVIDWTAGLYGVRLPHYIKSLLPSTSLVVGTELEMQSDGEPRGPRLPSARRFMRQNDASPHVGQLIFTPLFVQV